MQAIIPRKNYQKLTNTYKFLAVVLVVAAGVNGYFQWQKLSSAQQAMVDEQTLSQNIATGVSKYNDLYGSLKKGFEEDFVGLKDAIQAVYPDQENYTILTQSLDKYMHDNSTNENPIFMSDLKFGEARIDKNKDYAVLPFSLTLTTSQENFDNFLHFVETSGALSEKVRLMDLNSISISFSESQKAETGTLNQSKQMLDVSLAMNAYFQTPIAKK